MPKDNLVNIETADYKKLGELFSQVALSEQDCDIVDSILEIKDGDIILCEATCLAYAQHVLSRHASIKELWLVPSYTFALNTTDEDYEALMNSLTTHGVFKGLAAVIPDAPLKTLITTQYNGVPIESALSWPTYHPCWEGLCNNKGALGAVIYPPLKEQQKNNPSLRKGNMLERNLAKVVELASGPIILGFDGGSNACVMMDYSVSGNPWEHRVSPLEIAVNDGCLIPSVIRTGIELLEETTVEALSSRIGRGTSLSEKDLKIMEKLNARVIEDTTLNEVSSSGKKLKRRLGITGRLTVMDKYYYAGDDDLYYVDGSCFNNGQIWPYLIDSMPKGQERYIVDSHDGEVILVSRNSKQIAVYRAPRPTLISNNVLIIRLGSDISADYLACWLRSSYARVELYNDGKLLSKGVLSNLSVPILDENIMEQVVRNERSIDQKIIDLKEQIAELESCNRFTPLAAVHDLG